MNITLKMKRILSSLIIFILFFYVFGILNVITATENNGIGTVLDTYSRDIIGGTKYTYIDSDNGKPQKHYVLEYDPKTAPLEAKAVYGTYAFGGDTLSTNVELLESKGYTVIAGVNGSPFDTSNGVTVGTLISDGVIISASSGKSGYDSFAIREDGSMFISTSNLSFNYKTDNGASVNITHINKQKKEEKNYVYLFTNNYYSDTTSLAQSTEVILNVDSGSVSIGKELVCTVETINENTKRTQIPTGKVALVGSSLAALGNLAIGQKVTFSFTSNDDQYDWTKVTQSVCGFYQILKDGEYVNSGDPSVHPRTTIGYKADGTIVLYVVDGRQPNFSIGLTDLACAQYMKSLGCVAAIRMDGGGSSTMGLRLPGYDNITTVNSPSDGQERNDADGLLLVLKNDYNQNVGDETLLHAYPNNISILQNTVMPITVRATDERYNPKQTPEYTMEVLDGCGSIVEGNKFKAKEGTGSGKIKITSGSSETFVNVSVTNEVDELYANVNNLALSPQEEVSLSVKAYHNRSLLTASNEAFTWTCDEGLGTVDNKGKFIASSTAGVSGYIYINYGDTQAKVMVTVGQLPKEITGFENDKCGSSVGQWQNKQVNGGSGSCEINEDIRFVKYGYKSLKINFNLKDTTGTVGTQIWTGTSLKVEGTPTAIGMWVYADDSAQGAWIRLQYTESGSTAAKYADFGTIDWKGWKYLEAPIEAGVSYPVSVQYLVRIMGVNASQRINGVIYVDQLRAVYGFKNDDFDSPEITDCYPSADSSISDVTNGVSCKITDTMSGINKANSKFYLDGEEITNLVYTDIADGFIMSWTPSSLIPLNNGKHKVMVRAEDNYGNFIVKEWEFMVLNSISNFKLDYDQNCTLGENVTINLLLKGTNLTSFDLSMKYDLSQFEVSDEVTVSNGFTVSSKNIGYGLIKLTITKDESFTSDEEFVVLTLKAKTLKLGKATINVSSLEYAHKDYTDEKLAYDLEDIVIEVTYDYSTLKTLASKLDENNILGSLSDLKAALTELENIDRSQVTEQEVLDAIAKIDLCAQKYDALLALLQGVKESSSTVGGLIGGKYE